MRRFVVLVVTLLVAGCAGLSSSDDNDADDFHVPMVCEPKHDQLPCASGVAQGVEYRFNLLTHCGVEWAYFDGRYWVPTTTVKTPSHWAAIEAGTLVLERPDLAVFAADEGVGARFAPASASYRPPSCE
jgi:hypothetical protein